jgi:hypothetical protein
VQLARTPDQIRGYEEIKLRNVELAKRRADLLLGRLEAGGRLLPVVGGRPGLSSGRASRFDRLAALRYTSVRRPPLVWSERR